MINHDTEIASGTEIAFNFPGDFDDLNEAQVRFHNKRERLERHNWLCNKNSLKGIRNAIQKKYGQASITVCNVFEIIRDNGYLNDDFLSQTFALTVNDVRRGLENGLVPPSVKTAFSKYFNIQ